MKIVDKYIIQKFIGTFMFMLLLLSTVVVVIDAQSKTPRIEENGFTVSYFLAHYYPYWMIYLVMTFMSILVFISVIYFTSRMANNTEIVAIISSGASFHRFAQPYLLTAFSIAIISLGINHFVLPWANIKKNELEVYTYNSVKRDTRLGSTSVSTQLTPEEYIFISSFNQKEKRGSGFSYQKFDKNKRLVYQLNASEINWDKEKKTFTLQNYFEKKILKNDKEIIANGAVKQQDFKYPPEELFPNESLGQNKITPDLLKFIQREKQKGNANIASYLNELHQRTSMPVSIIILTIVALSLSSQKRRGGLGLNLAIGISLAFLFVFSFEALKVVSESKTLKPMFAMWLPNIIFAPIAIFLYIKRANQ